MITRPAHTIAPRSNAFGIRSVDWLVPIVTIGSTARKVLQNGVNGHLVAVFERSFYVESDAGGLACVGRGDIGAGPLNALLRLDERMPAIYVGLRARVENDSVILQNSLRFDMAKAEPWRPPPFPKQWAADDVRLGLEEVAIVCKPHRTRKEISPFLPLLGPVGEWPRWARTHVFGRHAAKGVDALSAWLERGFEAEAPISLPPDDVICLIGLGPGLTPSGDDFIGGIMICLSAIGRRSMTRVLADWSLPIARQRTGRISQAHLACAAKGEGAAIVHAMLNAVVRNDIRQIRHGVRHIARMGQPSGFDALAGIGFALSAWARTAAHSGSYVECRSGQDREEGNRANAVL